MKEYVIGCFIIDADGSLSANMWDVTEDIYNQVTNLLGTPNVYAMQEKLSKDLRNALEKGIVMFQPDQQGTGGEL